MSPRADESIIDVLHVTDALGVGGAEQNLASVVRRLDPKRFRSHLAWLFADDTAVAQFRPYVASCIPLGAVGGSLGLVGATLRLAQWMRRHRPHVAHAQLVRAQLVTRIAALASGGIPVITTLQNVAPHEREVSDFGGPSLRALYQLADSLTGRFDRRFVAVSQHVAKSWARENALPEGRFSVIHNSVEPDRYSPLSPAALASLRESLGVRPGEKILLTVGRLVPQKRQAELLAAMPAILSTVPHAVLLVAGGGPLLADLQSKARAMLLGDRVRFLGFHMEVPGLYQLADVFILPSSYEGLSVALLEALANGVPAVVSDIPSNLEVCAGLSSVRVVPVGDTAALAREIVAVLQADAGVLRAAQTADAIRFRFDPAAQVRQFEDLVSPLARAASR